MAIAVTCDCGRSLKVKDEMSGKKGRCPACNAVVNIPSANEEPETGFALAESPDEPRPKKPAARRYRDEQEEERPSRRASRDEEDDYDRPARRRPSRDEDEDDRPSRYRSDRDEDEDRPRRQDPPRPRPRRRVRRDSGGGGWAINGGALIGGLVSMAIAAVWFILGLMADRIFFFPPILFVLGLISAIKGLMGRGDD